MATFIPSGGGFLVLGNNLAEAIDGTNSNDTIFGYAGDDTIFGFDSDDYIDGGLGNDSLEGNFGNDTILGGAGNDNINDEGGFNFLFGGAGDDSLDGNDFDTLTGGAGNDTLDCDGTQRLVYNNPSEGGLFEVIQGFDTAASDPGTSDAFLISASGFGGGLFAGNPLAVNQFLAGAGVTVATTSAQRFLFDTTTFELRYDRDGTGISAPVFIATLNSGASDLAAVDFFIV